jgi:hypothetical protein
VQPIVKAYQIGGHRQIGSGHARSEPCLSQCITPRNGRHPGRNSDIEKGLRGHIEFPKDSEQDLIDIVQPTGPSSFVGAVAQFDGIEKLFFQEIL